MINNDACFGHADYDDCNDDEEVVEDVYDRNNTKKKLIIRSS